MCKTRLNRREWLTGVAVTGLAAAWPGSARAENAPATQATRRRRYRVSCAAYSYRKYLPQNKQPSPETLMDFMRHCAAWGCDGVEPTSYYFAGTDEAYLVQLKRLALDLGLDITGMPVRNDFANPPGERQDQQVAALKAWIDRAMILGVPAIRIFGGDPKKDMPREQALAYITEGVKRVCDHAAAKGVVLALENHGYMTERADDVLKIIDAVKHPWLMANLDTGNFVDKPYENIAQLAPRAVTCQVKIEVRTPDGKKREPVDLPRVVRILREAGYPGYLTLEYEGAEEPKTAIPQWLDKLRAAVQEDETQS